MRTASLTAFALAIALIACGGEATRLTVTPVKATLGKAEAECLLNVEISDGRVLQLDFLGSGVKSLKDNQGTDLGTKPAGKKPDYKTQPSYTQTSPIKGGRGLQVTVSSPKSAAATASSISLEGILKLKVGLDAREGQLKNVALAKGSQFLMGGQQASITEVRKTDQSTEFTLEFAAEQGLFVQEMKLSDAEGKGIFCSYDVSSASGGAERRLTVSFKEIAKPLDKVQLSYVLLADARTIEVPFKVTVPIPGSGAEAQPAVIEIGGGNSNTSTPKPVGNLAPEVKPVGDHGVRIPPQLKIGEAPTVEITKPPKQVSGEQYILTFVAAGRPDKYWGHWQLFKAEKKVYTLRAPRNAGSFELRLGYAKWPQKTYRVLDRVKVRVTK
jgi:hypothetical protein